MKNLPADWLPQLKKVYPKRVGGQGWGHLKRRIPVLIDAGESFEDLLDSAKKYAASMEATRQTNTPFVMQARTFFGPGEWWLEDYELPTDGSVELTLDQTAKKFNLVRGDGESDASLRKRIGIAETTRMYELK